ncbi:MAG TPA: hypothetical protein PLN21_08150 [Gemmatales bacterium]|nr:hypothetical protein [Gemmatales bacterium]
MRPFLLSCFAILAGLLFLASPLHSDEEAAIKAIQKDGGQVTKAPKLPGNPVIEVTYRFRNSSTSGHPELKHLKEFKSLQSLNLEYTLVTDSDLKEVSRLTSLQTLHLGVALNITDAGIKELKPLQNLQTLILASTKVTGQGLNELKGLKVLNLVGTKCSDAVLKQLSELKNLEFLDLGLTSVTDVGLKDLKGMKSLQTLYLGNTQVTDVGIQDLRELKSLQLLQVRHTKVTKAGVDKLNTALPQLRIEYR